MDKLFEVLPPSMPNFVSFKKEALLRQDGFKVEHFDIVNFTKEEAEDYAKLMADTFLKHWEDRKTRLFDD